MKFLNPLIVVSDLEKSKLFYKEVLGLEVISDFGENITLTGGVALQTQESWVKFIHKENHDISYGGNDVELYFEEKYFDDFINKLYSIPYIDYVHPLVQHSWGQRAVRFYDPDKHIIEVGENMIMVVQGFVDSGMSIEETAIAMDVPIEYVKHCLK